MRVHYNSAQPATVQAAAYAQGTDIHVAPGQERHLPHEAWHVVQQMQGRVRPTMQAQGVPINDDGALEREADTMGAQALQLAAEPARARAQRIVQAPDVSLQRRIVIGGQAFVSMKQVADDNVAWGQYAALNQAQRSAFKWLMRSAYDFPLADAADSGAWIVANGLQGQEIFEYMRPRDMVSMSFLVKEADYANWAHRAQAITFLLTLPHLDAAEFAHRYKSYYHLWRRFEKGGDNNPAPRVEQAMVNVEGALGEANVTPQEQAGVVGNLYQQQQYVVDMARAGRLRFASDASAATHFIKHGSYLKGMAGKITGEEGQTPLKQMGGEFIAHANVVVGYGTPQQVITTSADGPIFRYIQYDSYGNQYIALAQYVTADHEAVLLSYFPSEPANVVMDR